MAIGHSAAARTFVSRSLRVFVGSAGVCVWTLSSFSSSLSAFNSARRSAVSMSTATTAAPNTNDSRTTQRAAIAQLRSTNDKLANLVSIAQCAAMAREEGAAMLFLPECFGYMGETSQQTLENAEPPIINSTSSSTLPTPNAESTSEIQEVLTRIIEQSSPKAAASEWKEQLRESVLAKDNSDVRVSLLHGLQVIAKASGLWISGGGMHESGAPPPNESGDVAIKDGRPPPRSRVYNSHVILDKDGNVRALYRKTHLFDVKIPNKVNLCESATTAPGNKLVVCDSPIGKLGIATCYDVRFPEMFIHLVRKGGARVILVPSAFTVPTGSAHWHILLRARAIESQCYVLAAAQYGRHNGKRTSYGHSLAVDPWGRVLVDAGGSDGPGSSLLQQQQRQQGDGEQEEPPTIITCHIDLQELESIRGRMPIQEHRDVATFTM